MKIKMVNSVAGLNFTYAMNEEVDTEEFIANDLIKAGHAEKIKEESNKQKTIDKKVKKQTAEGV